MVGSRGQFTYWSQRTFARPVNRGLRLDYFLASPDLFAVSPETVQAEDAQEEEEVSHAARRRTFSESHLPNPAVSDCYILHQDTVGCSDHCPIVLVLKL